MIHVIITEVSWKVTMIAGVHVWAIVIVSKESLLLGPPTHSAFCSLDPKIELFMALRSSLDYPSSWPSPRPNIWVGPLSLQLFYILYTSKKKKIIYNPPSINSWFRHCVIYMCWAYVIYFVPNCLCDRFFCNILFVGHCFLIIYLAFIFYRSL